jgi:hypothetical protein
VKKRGRMERTGNTAGDIIVFSSGGMVRVANTHPN